MSEARLADAILQNKGFAKGKSLPMVDPTLGSSMGHMTNLGSYVNHTPYVRKQLIAVLIEAPRGFKALQDNGRAIATLRELIENASKTIDGLTQTLTPDFVSADFGGAGETHEVISDMKRAKSEPQHVWVERYGRPIGTFLDFWGLTFGMDPITKIPNIVTMGVQPPDLLPDYTCATVLYFEPDPTFRYVDKAFLCTNMFPKAFSPVEGRRDMTAAGDLVEMSIGFTAITQVGTGVDKFAETILQSLTLNGASPNLQPAYLNRISEDVKAASTGYANNLTRAKQAAVSL